MSYLMLPRFTGELVRVDWHMHSFYSDGSLSPPDLAFENSLIGNQSIALTDHDSISGVRDFLSAAHDLGIEGIPGVEISTSLYHILGYFIDVENKDLVSLVEHACIVQNEITRLRCENLSLIGIPIDYEKVRAAYPWSRHGKANLVNTILLDRECKTYFRKEFGRQLSGREIFDLYLAKGKPGGWVKGPKAPRAKYAIDIIHKAYGVAVVAHPFKDAKTPKSLEGLKRSGLDGVEYQPNFGKKNDPYIKWAKENGLHITYGSDFHGPHFPRPLLNKNNNLVEKFW